MSKEILIIARGSIGQRHGDVAQRLGHGVSFVSSSSQGDGIYPTLDSAFLNKSPSDYDLIIVASPTSEHANNISQIRERGYLGKILCEKPLLSDLEQRNIFSSENIFVGYNLRFHPGLQALKEEIQNLKIISVQVYCGSYMPDWRPGKDYKSLYSSSKKLGGGVLRDLSHEIDYIIWLFGRPLTIKGVSLSTGILDIETEDVSSFIFKYQNFLVNGELNYLDKSNQRFISIRTTEGNLHLDLNQNTLKGISGDVRTFPHDRNLQYEKQLIDILGESHDIASDAESSLYVCEVIEQIEELK